jgi:hypothetical protein
MNVPKYGIVLGDKKVTCRLIRGDIGIMMAFYGLPEPYSGEYLGDVYDIDDLAPITGLIFKNKISIEIFGKWFGILKSHIEELPD